MSLKEKLSEALGVAGLILWYVLAAAFVIIPIAATGLPLIWRIIIFVVLMVIPDPFGALLTIALFVYATIAVLRGPIDTFAIIYFVCLGLYIIFRFIPAMITLVNGLRRR